MTSILSQSIHIERNPKDFEDQSALTEINDDPFYFDIDNQKGFQESKRNLVKACEEFDF